MVEGVCSWAFVEVMPVVVMVAWLYGVAIIQCSDDCGFDKCMVCLSMLKVDV